MACLRPSPWPYHPPGARIAVMIAIFPPLPIIAVARPALVPPITIVLPNPHPGPGRTAIIPVVIRIDTPHHRHRPVLGVARIMEDPAIPMTWKTGMAAVALIVSHHYRVGAPVAMAPFPRIMGNVPAITGCPRSVTPLSTAMMPRIAMPSRTAITVEIVIPQPIPIFPPNVIPHPIATHLGSGTPSRIAIPPGIVTLRGIGTNHRIALLLAIGTNHRIALLLAIGIHHRIALLLVIGIHQWIALRPGIVIPLVIVTSPRIAMAIWIASSRRIALTPWIAISRECLVKRPPCPTPLAVTPAIVLGEPGILSAGVVPSRIRAGIAPPGIRIPGCGSR